MIVVSKNIVLVFSVLYFIIISTAVNWMRVTGELKEDTRREARVAMMNENEASLSSMYTVDDNLMTVFYFDNAKVTFYENGKEPVVEDLSL